MSAPSPFGTSSKQRIEAELAKLQSLEDSLSPMEWLEVERKAKAERLQQEKKRREAKERAELARLKQLQDEHASETLMNSFKGMGEHEFRAKLRPLFDKIDRDHSGSIDVHELKKMTQVMKLRLTDAQLRGMMREADVVGGGNGLMEFDEFALLMRKQTREGSSAWDAVLSSDANGGGGLFGGLSSLFSPSKLEQAAQAKAKLKAEADAAEVERTRLAAEAEAKAKAAAGRRSSSPSSISSSAVRTNSPSRSNSPSRAGPIGKGLEKPKAAASYSPASGSAAAAGAAGAAGGAQDGKEEVALRARLLPVFQRFDLDHSGAVSTAEMGKMLKQLKMDKSTREVKQMMHEADPDGSGQIDFDEFVAVLKKQMKEGGGSGGGLLSVFSGAAGLLGLFNPFSWFAADVPSPPVSSGPRSPVRTYGGGVWSVSAELSAPQLRTRLFEKYIDPKWEQRRLNTPVKV